MTLWLVPLLPLAGAAVVLLLRRRGPIAMDVAALVALAATLLAALWASAAMPATEWAGWGPQLAPTLAVVGVARMMAPLVPAIAIPVVLYAASAERDGTGLPRLLALLVAFTGIMELLVLAGDLLTLLVAWELVGACSWALVGFEYGDVARPRAALTTFITTRAGDLGLYLAAGAAMMATGSLRFDALQSASAPLLGIVALGTLVAAAAKSAQLPFSPWLFAAMKGPTSASALLHSATMVAAGAYLLARLAPAFDAVPWYAPAVAGLGLATAGAGGVVASTQTDFKKALAASTSAQYGLMFVAIGAGVPAAAGAHLVAHAAFKALLFLSAGVALHAAGTLDLGRLRLGAALPRVAALALVGALALAAVPPLGGAYTKEQIVAAAASGPSGNTWLAAGVLAAGALSAFYSMRLFLLAYGRGARRDALSPPRAERASLALLAALSFALGLLWLPDADAIIARAMGTPLASGTMRELALSLATVAIGLAAGWLLERRGALLTLGLPGRTRVAMSDWLGLPAFARVIIVRPAFALARALAALDDRVVDAGVRGSVRVAALASRILSAWGERGFDGVVRAVTRGAEATARASSRTDDRTIDGAVEGLARGVDTVGGESRRLQTGLAHQYYLIVAVGVLAIVAAAAFGQLTFGR